MMNGNAYKAVQTVNYSSTIRETVRQSIIVILRNACMVLENAELVQRSAIMGVLGTPVSLAVVIKCSFMINA